MSTLEDAALKRRDERGWDTCPDCGKDIVLTRTGVLRAHGPRNRRCGASGFHGLKTWAAARVAAGTATKETQP